MWTSSDTVFPEIAPSGAVRPTVRLSNFRIHLAYHLPGCRDSALVTFENPAEWSYHIPDAAGVPSYPHWHLHLSPHTFQRVDFPSTHMRQRWAAAFHGGIFECVAHRWFVRAERVVDVAPPEAIHRLLGPGRDLMLDDLGESGPSAGSQMLWTPSLDRTEWRRSA